MIQGFMEIADKTILSLVKCDKILWKYVRCTGLEPVTPALSRRCSEPTELTSQKRAKILFLALFFKSIVNKQIFIATLEFQA